MIGPGYRIIEFHADCAHRRGVAGADLHNSTLSCRGLLLTRSRASMLSTARSPRCHAALSLSRFGKGKTCTPGFRRSSRDSGSFRAGAMRAGTSPGRQRD
jgi:hypothetical protein